MTQEPVSDLSVILPSVLLTLLPAVFVLTDTSGDPHGHCMAVMTKNGKEQTF